MYQAWRNVERSNPHAERRRTTKGAQEERPHENRTTKEGRNNNGELSGSEREESYNVGHKQIVAMWLAYQMVVTQHNNSLVVANLEYSNHDPTNTHKRKHTSTYTLT